jgi:hypothetical protein
MKTVWRLPCSRSATCASGWIPMPDFADLHQQRQRHAHLFQQLLWEEYRKATRTAIATPASASYTSAGDASKFNMLKIALLAPMPKQKPTLTLR